MAYGDRIGVPGWRAAAAVGLAVLCGAGPYPEAVRVRLDHPLYWRGGHLRYTTDGTDPVATSPAYTGPIDVAAPTTIRAAEFDDAGHAGAIGSQVVDVRDVTPPTVVSAEGTADEVRVTFSEPVTPASAGAVAHYRFDPPVRVVTAGLSGDGRTVTLALQPTRPAAAVRLSIDGVTDRSPAANVMRPTTVAINPARPVFTMADYAATGGPGLARPAPGVPVGAGQPWTINCFVRPDEAPDGMTVIAGFGRCADDADGVGRYLCKFPEGLHYWSRNRDGVSDAPLDVGRWAMLSAAYDGRAVTMYKDGEPIGRTEVTLADDEAVVRLAPADPWSGQERFIGRIRDFAVWNAALPPAAVHDLWVGRPALGDVRPDAAGGVRITVDTSQAPDLGPWAAETLVPTLRAWYPKIAADLPVPGHPPPDHFSIVFDTGYTGVAATSGTHVVANPAWFRANLKGEAVGALLHEAVHVVQSPSHTLRGRHMPTWLLEGTADHIRWFQFEPPSARPRVRPDCAQYDASYRTTAAFLAWVLARHDRDLLVQMNAANYAGTYSDDLWVKYTGRTAAALGAEWKQSLGR